MTATNFRLNVILNHLNGPTIKKTATKNYKYTVDNNFLSKEQKDFYEENGYLVIPSLIDGKLLDQFYERFLDICNKRVPVGNMTLMKEKSLLKSNKKGENLYYKVQDILWDEILQNYPLHPTLLNYVECFTGPNIEAVHSMLINKPPDTGSKTSQHPMHQDLHYFPFRPIDRIVASWTAMEKITVDNGCLYVVPGTHKASLQPHGYPEDSVNAAFHAVRGFDKVNKVDLPMEKGDTVFFHPLLFHGSHPNFTEGFRKAISCHFASSDCYYIDVKGTSQEEVSKEVVKIAKIKYGLDMNVHDTWKLRKRLIRGRQGTLI